MYLSEFSDVSYLEDLNAVFVKWKNIFYDKSIIINPVSAVVMRKN